MIMNEIKVQSKKYHSLKFIAPLGKEGQDAEWTNQDRAQGDGKS
jgi:hypothetical protein